MPQPQLLLIAAPNVEPISLAEARLNLRISSDQTAEDARIAMAIQAARETAEHILGRRLITQTWEMVLDAFPADGEALRLHTGLVQPQSVAQITYLNAGGSTVTWAGSNYALDAVNLPGYIFPVAGQSWPVAADSANAVRVRVVCGYGSTAASVPASIREWMLLQIGAAYETRAPLVYGRGVSAVPEDYTRALLQPHRVYLEA